MRTLLLILVVASASLANAQPTPFLSMDITSRRAEFEMAQYYNRLAKDPEGELQKRLENVTRLHSRRSAQVTIGGKPPQDLDTVLARARKVHEEHLQIALARKALLEAMDASLQQRLADLDAEIHARKKRAEQQSLAEKRQDNRRWYSGTVTRSYEIATYVFILTRY